MYREIMLRNESIFQISTFICVSSTSICNLLIDWPTYNIKLQHCDFTVYKIFVSVRCEESVTVRTFRNNAQLQQPTGSSSWPPAVHWEGLARRCYTVHQKHGQWLEETHFYASAITEWLLVGRFCALSHWYSSIWHQYYSHIVSWRLKATRVERYGHCQATSNGKGSRGTDTHATMEKCWVRCFLSGPCTGYIAMTIGMAVVTLTTVQVTKLPL
jgi:hypothetical protein